MLAGRALRMSGYERIAYRDDFSFQDERLNCRECADSRRKNRDVECAHGVRSRNILRMKV